MEDPFGVFFITKEQRKKLVKMFPGCPVSLVSARWMQIPQNPEEDVLLINENAEIVFRMTIAQAFQI
jgi:hypothetical protein